MAPAPRRAEWVDVRPLRRTRAPTPGASTPSEPRPRQTTTRQAFLACDHRPPLPGVKLVRPRQRPDRRTGYRRSSLTPDRAASPEYQQLRAKPAQQPTPGDYQVTGSGQHAPLTGKAPMGGYSARVHSCSPTGHRRHGKSGPGAAGRLRSDAAGTSPSAISLAEHRIAFGVGPDLPDLLRAAAGDGDLGSPLQRLLA